MGKSATTSSKSKSLGRASARPGGIGKKKSTRKRFRISQVSQAGSVKTHASEASGMRIHVRSLHSKGPVARKKTSAAKANSPSREAQLAHKLITAIEAEGSDVMELCETYGLKREELGRLTGFSLRALAEWAAGKLPSQPAKRRLHEIRRLMDALAEVVQVKSISGWLHKPNPAFDKMTPLQVIEVGEMDRLWGMVHAMGHGVPE